MGDKPEYGTPEYIADSAVRQAEEDLAAATATVFIQTCKMI